MRKYIKYVLYLKCSKSNIKIIPFYAFAFEKKTFNVFKIFLNFKLKCNSFNI